MTNTEKLVDVITKGIQEKKGEEIVVVDLRRTEGAITSFFVICQGNSPIQVDAIAESVGDMARIELGEKPVNVNALETSHWVAMDFVDVIVHIFLPEVRDFYRLEDLWQDAPLTKITEVSVNE